MWIGREIGKMGMLREKMEGCEALRERKYSYTKYN